MTYNTTNIANAISEAPTDAHKFVADILYYLIQENPESTKDELSDWMTNDIWGCQHVIYYARARETYLELLNYDPNGIQETEDMVFGDYDPTDIHDAFCKTVGVYMDAIASELIADLEEDTDPYNEDGYLETA